MLNSFVYTFILEHMVWKELVLKHWQLVVLHVVQITCVVIQSIVLQAVVFILFLTTNK